jgi:3-methyladenine DNA glycosylase AlkD
VSDFTDALTTHIAAFSDRDRAPAMEAYMKHKFVYFGLSSQVRRDALKDFMKHHPCPTGEALDDVVEELWRAPERELHYCAMELVQKTKRHKRADAIPLLEHMLTHQAWWDTVDFIAATLVGEHFRAHPDQMESTALRWNDSGDLWLIRSSILFQLKYKTQIDLDLLERLMLPHIDSREFFLQKVIGWVLRQISKHDPEYVRNFLQQHALKPVSMREAVKYL